MLSDVERSRHIEVVLQVQIRSLSALFAECFLRDFERALEALRYRFLAKEPVGFLDLQRLEEEKDPLLDTFLAPVLREDQQLTAREWQSILAPIHCGAQARRNPFGSTRKSYYGCQ